MAVYLVLVAGELAAEQTPAELLRQAHTDLDNGSYAAAIQEALRSAISFGQLGNSKDRAAALTVAGLGQMYSGDYPSAIHHFTDALEAASRIHDFGISVATLNDLGNAFYFEGRYNEAMDRYQAAIRLVKTAPNDRSNKWASQLTTANIAILYQSLGQFDRALSFYNQLLETGEALPPDERAQLLSNIGVLRRRLGDPQKALDTYRTAQELYRKVAHRDGEIAVLNNIGIVQAMDFQDSAAADATFSTALGLAEQSGDRPLAVHARLYRGETRYRAARLAESEADFQIAANSARELGEQEEEWKALYGLARLAAARGDKTQAAQLLGRSVKLIESLRGNAGAPSLRSAFLADKRAVYDLLIEIAPNIDEVFHWMEESRARTLRDRLGLVRKVPLQELARSLPPDTAVLEFWLGERSAATIWISAAQTGMKRWTTNARIIQAISSVPSALSDLRNLNWRSSIQPVGEIVLSGLPILENKSIRNLIIIPDGALSGVPFEAIPFKDSSLVVQHFRVTYAPSAYLLVKQKEDLSVRWPWQLSFAAFADPYPGEWQDAGIVAAHAWPRLPQASREVSTISRLLGGKSALHLHEDARKEWLSFAARYPVLHFATHAFADQRNPDLSYVLLAPPSKAHHFDYLFLKEVYALPLSAVKLVALSACETNIGTLIPGEGQQGLSQAFLSAGAHSVLASLWSVGDKATAELMIVFYGRLSAGESMSEALRHAKLEFLSHSRSSHPAYWAAFVLSGDGDARLPLLIGWPWFGGVLLLAAMFIFILARRSPRVTIKTSAKKAQSFARSRRRGFRGSEPVKSR